MYYRSVTDLLSADSKSIASLEKKNRVYMSHEPILLDCSIGSTAAKFICRVIGSSVFPSFLKKIIKAMHKAQKAGNWEIMRP